MVDGHNASGGVLIIVLIMMNPGWIKITVIMTILDDD